MELEQQISQEQVVFRPKKRDSAGRDEQQVRAMDLYPAAGSKPLYPGSREVIAIGGNRPVPPALSAVDEAYADAIAEALREYPKALYRKAFKRERDAAGKIVPHGEVTPLSTADAISPNYPVPMNIAQAQRHQGNGFHLGRFAGDYRPAPLPYLPCSRWLAARRQARRGGLPQRGSGLDKAGMGHERK